MPTDNIVKKTVPRFAEISAKDLHRQALQSEYMSKYLPEPEYSRAG